MLDGRPVPAAPVPLLQASAGSRPSAQPTGPGETGYLYAAVLPRRPARLPVAVPPRPGRSPLTRAVQRVGAVGLVGALALVAQSSPVGTVVQFVDGGMRAGALAGADVRLVQQTTGGLVLAAQHAPVLPTPGPAAPGARVPSQHVEALGGGGSLAAVPAPVLAAYRSGAALAGTAHPGCGLSWSVLAGIGELESRHAASGGSGRPGWDGTASPPILGPVLDGRLGGTAVVRDTDGGRLDGDPAFDRAVGPMQMLPATWSAHAADGNGDGVSDPQQVADAAAAAGLFLCSHGDDLTDARRLVAALDRYNHSTRYVRAVLAAGAGHLAASLGPTPSGVAQAALAFAWKSLGDPYLWGGNGPLYDCSGLTTAAYRSAGVLLPRTAGEQWQRVPPVPLGQLVVGDLVFFSMGLFRPGVPGHVGIYLGDGLMLNAPRTGAFVRIDSIDRPGIVGAARPSLLATYAGAPPPGSGLVLPPTDGPLAPSPVQRPTPLPHGTATPSSAGTALPAGTAPPPRPGAVPATAPATTAPATTAPATTGPATTRPPQQSASPAATEVPTPSAPATAAPLETDAAGGPSPSTDAGPP